MTYTERRELLKSMHRCVVCAKKLDDNYTYLRCHKCRVAQAQASKKWRMSEGYQMQKMKKKIKTTSN